MSLFNLFKNDKDYGNIIYVLDRLLQISIDGEAINKSRNVDMGLYRILNSPKVNQEIIHQGLSPLVRENKKLTQEFIQFVNNLSIYMEYDINTDFLYAKTINGTITQKGVQEKIIFIKKNILQYLLGKKLISKEQYSDEINRKVKTF